MATITTEDVFNRLTAKFPNLSLALDAVVPHPIMTVPRESLVSVAEGLRQDTDFCYESLTCLTGVERGGGLEAVYSLYSRKLKHHLTLRVKVAYDDAVIPTVIKVWPAVDWHEREVFDMFGITFDGHPDHRRILCPDDWEGHPLRKDYQPPLFFHGIPVTVNVPGGVQV